MHCSDKSCGALNYFVREPLLQHYGIEIRWLDLVDNFWIALWFSMHEYKTATYDRVYDFVEQKEPDDSLSYLILMYSDVVDPVDDVHGLFRGEKTELIDLCVAIPSIFLRPHNQHPMLMKPRNANSVEDADLIKCVNLIIAIETRKIRDWIGTGRLLIAENYTTHLL